MCRLAYIPKAFKGMAEWLAQLEQSAGGDGVGVAVGRRHCKGVRMTVQDAAAAAGELQMRGRKRLPVLFHTRRTSSGGDSDELCHPFACAEGWLAHNGHWHAGHVEAQKVKGRGPMSDSRFFSMVVDDLGFEAAVEELRPPGVWLHMHRDGDLAVWKNGGSLFYCPSLGVWGSEPPDVGLGIKLEGGWHRVDDGLHGYGETPEEPGSWWWEQ